MIGNYTTEGVGSWIDAWSPSIPESIESVALKRGHGWLRRAGVATRSDDLAVLAYLCFEGMSEYYHAGRLEDDYEVANEVLDEYVTDHDAELLVQAVPEVAREATGEIGGMTNEVTAVHTVLLRVVGAMRESWQARDES